MTVADADTIPQSALFDDNTSAANAEPVYFDSAEANLSHFQDAELLNLKESNAGILQDAIYM